MPFAAPSVEQAIARCQSQLRFIPTLALKQIRVIKMLNDFIKSDLCLVDAIDSLAFVQLITGWPLRPERLVRMMRLDPIFQTLVPLNPIYCQLWTARPGIAFFLPDELYLQSLLYAFVFKELDARHVIVFPFSPSTSDGVQVIVYCLRGHEAPPYSAAELRIVEQVCHHFESILNAPSPADHYKFRPASPAEHEVTVDADFRPLSEMPLLVQALFALFYDTPRFAPGMPHALPNALLGDIRDALAQHRHIQYAAPPGLCTFTKAQRGRVLCLTLEVLTTGGYRLILREDVSQYPRLRRLKAACLNLKRDRVPVFNACLLLAEGVRDPKEIARRGGFPALKPSSAQKIINQAKRIVVEA